MYVYIEYNRKNANVKFQPWEIIILYMMIFCPLYVSCNAYCNCGRLKWITSKPTTLSSVRISHEFTAVSLFLFIAHVCKLC